MEPSPHPLGEGDGSVISGGCKSHLLSGEGWGEGAKKEACHDLNICRNSETVSKARPYSLKGCADQVHRGADMVPHLRNGVLSYYARSLTLA